MKSIAYPNPPRRLNLDIKFDFIPQCLRVSDPQTDSIPQPVRNDVEVFDHPFGDDKPFAFAVEQVVSGPIPFQDVQSIDDMGDPVADPIVDNVDEAMVVGGDDHPDEEIDMVDADLGGAAIFTFEKVLTAYQAGCSCLVMSLSSFMSGCSCRKAGCVIF